VLTEEPSQQQVTPPVSDEPSAIAPDFGDVRPPMPMSTSALRWLPWLDVLKAIGLWFLSVFLLLVIPLLAVVPYIIYKIQVAGGVAALTPEALKSDKMLIFWSVVGILPAHLLTLALAWLVVTEGGRRNFWSEINWGWPKWTNPIAVTLLSVLTALVLYGIAFGATTVYGGEKTDLDIMIESSNYTRIATALVAFATAPLVEEVIYRGIIYAALEKVMGVGFAVAVVSMLFAGVHVYQYRTNIAVILVITLLSITLTVARAVTGKLTPSFIIHLVFNGVQSVLIVLGGFLDKGLVK